MQNEYIHIFSTEEPKNSAFVLGVSTDIVPDADSDNCWNRIFVLNFWEVGQELGGN